MIKNKTILITFSVIVILASFGFAGEILATYYSSGYFTSTNLLSGVSLEVASIDSFIYNLSEKPAGTYAKVGFNQDGGATWYKADGTEGTETLVTGTDQTIILTSGWSGANFYYKTQFESTQYNTKGLWHFDEGEGTVVRDSSGNGNHGTFYGNNEVTEGGFETDTYWSGVTRDTSTVYTGNYSGKIVKETAGELVRFHGDMAIPDSSVQYDYGGCIYSNGPTAEIYFFSWDGGGSKYDGTYDKISTSQTGQWVCISGTTTNVVSADDYFDIRIDNNGGSAGAGTVWFDNIWARKVTTDSSWTTDGKFGNALSFGSKNDVVDISDINYSTISASMWYYFNGTGGTWNTLFCRDGGGQHHLLIQDSTNEIGFYNSSFYSSGYSLTAGNWYHIVLIKNGTNSKLYINGDLKQNSDSSFGNNNYPLSRIGNYGGETQGSLGKIDEVRILDIALTAEQIQADYEATKGFFEDGGTPVLDDITLNYTVQRTQPSVESISAIDITNESATLRGKITSTGGEDADLRGFEWGTASANPGEHPHSWTEGDSENYQYGTELFSHQLTGLSEGETYYFRAKAHNSLGWGYGEEKSFVAKEMILITVTIGDKSRIIEIDQEGRVFIKRE